MYFCVVIYQLLLFFKTKMMYVNLFLYLFSKHHYPFMVLPLLNSWNTVLLGFIGASTTISESDDVTFFVPWLVLPGMIGAPTTISESDVTFFVPWQVLLGMIGVSTVTSN